MTKLPSTTQKYEQRAFYERGKPTVERGVAPRFSYHTRKVWEDLNKRLDTISEPYDMIFTLVDEGVSIVVRAVKTDIGNTYISWSVNGRQFVRDDCAAKGYDIIDQLETALLGLAYHEC